MLRSPLIISGACLLIALAGAARVHPPTVPFTPASEKETSTAILPPSTPGAPTDLAYTADCLDTSPRQGLIAMTWSPGEGTSVAQRVDVTKFREGFEVGRFDVSSRLEPTTSAASLQDPEPGIHYYWRVLSETSDGWVSSPVERFEAPTCPSDGAVFDRSEDGE